MEVLPTPLELKQQVPLTDSLKDWIRASRQSASNILSNKDSRLVMVVGPCSIHHSEGAIEYAEKLKQISSAISDRIFLVMRAYVEKPRSSVGWKGLSYDPNLDGSYDLKEGLYQSRKLLLDLAKMGIPTAVEFLDPIASRYYDDLVTWGFIGARTSSSQPHRELASSLDFPIGFKNTVDGCIDTAINGVLSAKESHHFFGMNDEGKAARITSSGNANAHLVLRGSTLETNFDEVTISSSLKKLGTLHLPEKILIDCSHGNSQKDFSKQKNVFFSIMDQIESLPSPIMGLMLESYLKSGSMPLTDENRDLIKDVSITDGCIDWDTTETLLRWAYMSLGTRDTSFSDLPH